MSDCAHPIWRYLGSEYRGDRDERGRPQRTQRHVCIDCGMEQRDVPSGAVMIGHAPGECACCDSAASALSEEQRSRWIRLTKERRL